MDTIPLYMLIQRSVALIQAHAPKDGRLYLGRYSGGKDSDTIMELARMAGVPVDWTYSLTTIDPPEVVRHVWTHADVRTLRATWRDRQHIVHSSGHLLQRALVRGFPTHMRRWCCQEFKETTEQTPGSTILLGIRIAESPRRKERWPQCYGWRHHEHETDTGQQKIVLPIRLWSDANVWEFLRSRNVRYCSLYDEGFKRLGCVGCPMTTRAQREVEFARWPKHEALWRRMFERLWVLKSGTVSRKGLEWFGSRVHDSSAELWDWWMDRCPNASKWRANKGLRIKDVRDHK